MENRVPASGLAAVVGKDRNISAIETASMTPTARTSASIAVWLDVEQGERGIDAGQIGWRCRVQIGFVEFGELGDTQQPEAADHFVLQ